MAWCSGGWILTLKICSGLINKFFPPVAIPRRGRQCGGFLLGVSFVAVVAASIAERQAVPVLRERFQFRNEGGGNVNRY